MHHISIFISVRVFYLCIYLYVCLPAHPSKSNITKLSFQCLCQYCRLCGFIYIYIYIYIYVCFSSHCSPNHHTYKQCTNNTSLKFAAKMRFEWLQVKRSNGCERQSAGLDLGFAASQSLDAHWSITPVKY